MHRESALAALWERAHKVLAVRELFCNCSILWRILTFTRFTLTRASSTRTVPTMPACVVLINTLRLSSIQPWSRPRDSVSADAPSRIHRNNSNIPHESPGVSLCSAFPGSQCGEWGIRHSSAYLFIYSLSQFSLLMVNWSDRPDSNLQTIY